MPTTQTFVFNNLPTDEDGNTISLSQWVETLSAEDQTAYAAAEADRLEKVQTQINIGDLTIDEDTGAYIWADGADPSSVVTDEWYAFFNRYLTENNITFVDQQT